MPFTLITPEETAITLAIRAKTLRLAKKWKRSTLSERSGVTTASIRRFEETGQVSMKHFLKIVFALGRLDEMNTLLEKPKASSIADLEKMETQLPQRGSI